jgi:4-hydroxybenzoate polyprenyltransferase
MAAARPRVPRFARPPAPALLGWAGVLRLTLLEARPSVQLVFLLRFCSAAALAGVHSAGRFALAAVVYQLAIVVVYLYNGVADVTEDRLNQTGRPIASGRLPVATARRMTAAVAGAAVLAAGLFDRPMVLPVLGMLLLGALYSLPRCGFRRTPAGAFVVVVFGGLLTYEAGAVAAGWVLPPRDVVALAVCMATWMASVGTVTKDLSDVRGDAAAGRRSIPVLLGERRGRQLGAALALGVAGAFVLVGWHCPRLRPAAAVAATGALALTALSRRVPAATGRGGSRLPYRIFMVTQQCVHAAVLLTLW